MSVENRSQLDSDVPHPWSEFPTSRQYLRKLRMKDGLEIIPKSEILFLAEVRFQTMINPGKLLNMKKIADGIGTHRSRPRQLYTAHESEYELPPRQTRRSPALSKEHSLLLRQQAQLLRRIKAEKKAEDLDTIRALRLEGKGDAVISREAGIKPKRVTKLLKEILAADPSLRLRSRRRSKEEFDIFDKQVKYCRDVLLMTDNQTAQYLEDDVGLVKNSIKRQLSEGKMKRKKV